ncbi:MAG: hypothetical protein AAF968_00220 [Pseudomonadota bacterium]
MHASIPWQDLPRVRAFDFRSVPQWRKLPWKARAVYGSLRTLLAPLGRLPLLGHEPATLVAAELDLPLDFVASALEALQATSWILVENDALVDPNFLSQEHARQSTALRSRLARARRSGRRVVHPGQPVYLVVRAHDNRANWVIRSRGAAGAVGGKRCTYGDAAAATSAGPDAQPTTAGDAAATRRVAVAAQRDDTAGGAGVPNDRPITPRREPAIEACNAGATGRSESATGSAPSAASSIATGTKRDACATPTGHRATPGDPTRARPRTRPRLVLSSLPLFEQINPEQEEEKRRNAREAAGDEQVRQAGRTKPSKRESKAARRKRLEPIFEAHMDAYRAVLPACDRHRSNSETAWRTWSAAMKRNNDDADRVLAQLLGHRWDTWDQRVVFNELGHILKEGNDRFADWELHPEGRPLGADSATVYARHGDRQQQARIAETAPPKHHFVTDFLGGRLERPAGEELAI